MKRAAGLLMAILLLLCACAPPPAGSDSPPAGAQASEPGAAEPVQAEASGQHLRASDKFWRHWINPAAPAAPREPESSAAPPDASQPAERKWGTYDEPWRVVEKPTPERALEPAFWWEQTLIDMMAVYPDTYEKGEVLRPYQIVYGVGHLMGTQTQYGFRSDGQGRSLVSPILFWDAVERFYGEANMDAERLAAYDAHLMTTTVGADGNVHDMMALSLPGRRAVYYMEHTDIIDIKLTEAGSADRVTLITEERNSDIPDRIERIATYELYWDDDVGYLPERISWRYPDTHYIKVEGTDVLFDTLWGQPGSSYYARMSYQGYTQSVGNKAYRFEADGTKLTVYHIDLTTLEQWSGTARDFGESVLGARLGDKGIVVETEKAVYLLSFTYEILARHDWPAAAVPKKSEYGYEHRYVAVTDDIAKVAWADSEGLYLCDLARGSEPQRITGHPVTEEDIQVLPGGNPVMLSSIYPVRFVGNDRLFCGLSGWEASAIGYRMIDLEGNTLDAFQWFVSWEHSGGQFYSTPEGALHAESGMDGSMSFSFYDFAAMRESYCFWAKVPRSAIRAMPSPTDGLVWYVNVVSYIYGDQIAGYTDFYRIDCRNKTATRLPFRVEGAEATILAVGEDDALLVSYAYLGEQGFAVYRGGDTAA